MRIVFFGTPSFSAEFLKALIADPSLQVVGVVAQPDEPVGRKKVLTSPPTKVLAEEHGIPVLQPRKLKDDAFQQSLHDLAADVFVVVAYGRIIPQAVLDIPRLGCVNVHPSLLPLFRGPSPMQAAIAAGHTQTGVSIMLLDAGMDTGPILAQQTIQLPVDATYSWLAEEAVRVGAPLLLATLKQPFTPQPQDDTKATLCTLLTREHGKIDWTQPATAIDAAIRAYNPWPGTTTVWMRNNEPVAIKIFRAQHSSIQLVPGLVAIKDNQLFVGTGTTALIINELQPATGKRMDSVAFIRGYSDINSTTLG